MRFARTLTAILLVFALVISVSVAEMSYTVTINPTGQIVLAPGQSLDLTVTIEPVNLIEHNVMWSSENPLVAKVDAKGRVTAHAAGTTYIHATIESGNDCRVYVRVSGKAVTKLAITDSDIELELNKTAQLTYIITEDADDKRVLWQSDDTKVATVNQNGLVKAVGYGTAVITLISANGTTANASVYVPSDVKSIKLDPADAFVALGGEARLEAYVFPGNARDRKLTWSSSNENVARVDSNGTVKGISAGTCVISARAKNGVSANANITVEKAPTSMTLSSATVVLSRDNRSAKLSALVQPKAAEGCELIWASSDENVVTVREGKLAAVGYGKAVVSATARNGLSAECIVYVSESAESVAFQNAVYALTIGSKPVKAELVFTPSYAFEKDIKWTVDNERVATVDENGLLTPVRYGTTTVTAVTKSGLSATAEVRVYEDTRSIVFPTTGYTLNAYTALEVKVVSRSNEPMGIPLKWTSSDPDICSVSNGILYGRNPGVATIIASTEDGALSASCKATVLKNNDVTVKRIALTFDNGPSANTPQVLEALEAFGAKSTFFLLGANIETRKDTAKLFENTLHEIGNHTYDNTSFNTSTMAEIATAIEKTDTLIYAAIGREATLLRSADASLPKQIFSSFLDTRRFVGKCADMFDTLKTATAEQIRDRALSECFDGAVLTFHDSGAHTAEALYMILPELILNGYTFVTVSELIELTGDENAIFTTKR